MTINIGINGMGRIGRMVIRAIIESKNKNIQIKISVLLELTKFYEQIKKFT